MLPLLYTKTKPCKISLAWNRRYGHEAKLFFNVVMVAESKQAIPLNFELSRGIFKFFKIFIGFLHHFRFFRPIVWRFLRNFKIKLKHFIHRRALRTLSLMWLKRTLIPTLLKFLKSKSSVSVFVEKWKSSIYPLESYRYGCLSEPSSMFF